MAHSVNDSKRLLTGGLLGLAGLGILPNAVEAQTPELQPQDTDPAGGAAIAPNPRQVTTPEPTAATTEPQIDAANDPQPDWSPSLDANTPPPEPVALAPERQKPGPKAAPLALSLEVTAVAAPEAVAPAIPEVVPEPVAEVVPVPEALTAPVAIARADRSSTPPQPAAPTAADSLPELAPEVAPEPPPSPRAVTVPSPKPEPRVDAAATDALTPTLSFEAIAAKLERANAIAAAPLPTASLPPDPRPTDLAPQASRSGPQLPNLPTATPRPAVAPAQPVLSPQRAAMPSFVIEPRSTTPETPREHAPTLAQATEAQADQIRQNLRVEPLPEPVAVPRSYAPSPNAGIPSAFGAEWGDVFISASLAGADRIRPEADGSLSLGLGLGDSRSLVGVELAYNILSMRRFAENGSFDVKVHREISRSDRTQVAAALGWNNVANYGSNVAGTESSPYGVLSAAHLLQPENPANRMPITGTLGVGGGSFSGTDSDVGVIAGVGLQVHPQMSVNTAWSGVGLNVSTSLVPAPSVPLTLTLTYGDITNNTEAGSVAVITLGYGFNFGPRF
jgi:hypothetical protein